MGGEMSASEMVEVVRKCLAHGCTVWSTTEVKALVEEIDRLKRGDLTTEEFQALCHNLHEKPGCTREAFEAGCREYQDLVFGKKG